MTVGSRWLLFLQRGSKDGAWEPVAPWYTDASRMAVQKSGAEPLVVWSKGVVPLTEVIMSPEGLLPLGAVVTAVEKWKPGRRPATYRVKNIECEKCDFRKILNQATATGARVCHDFACAAEAASLRMPFVAEFSRQGIDSAITEAIVGDADGRIRSIWYDSDIGGGLNLCYAAVFAKECSGLASDEQGATANCREKGDTTKICSEPDRTSTTLSAPRSVSELRCDGRHRHEFSWCNVGGKGETPPPNGPDLLCTPLRALGMACDVDSTMP